MALPLAGIVYVAWHVWVLLPLAGVWKCLLIGMGIVCFLLLFVGFSGGLEKMPLTLARMVYKTGTSSVLVLLYLVMAFLVLDLGRLVHLVPKAWLYGNGVTATAILGILATVFVCGNINYYNKVRVQINLNTDKPLPHDYKLVMASDLHLGYHNTRADLARWVDLNEYYSGEQRAEKFYREAGICLLRDSSVVVDSALVIIGRDDRFSRRRKPLEQLVGEATTQPFTILLDHQPHALEQAEKCGIDFQLSGHTHRGQVWPISWITDAIYECSWGSHRRSGTQYYVSSGLGIWGGKYRIGTQSEYVVATLRRPSR